MNDFLYVACEKFKMTMISSISFNVLPFREKLFNDLKRVGIKCKVIKIHENLVYKIEFESSEDKNAYLLMGSVKEINASFRNLVDAKVTHYFCEQYE